MRSVIITGAAGFVGCYLTSTLSDHGYNVYAIVRPGSEHNNRIRSIPNVVCIEIDVENLGAEAIDKLSSKITDNCDFFFDLIWRSAGRYDFSGQMESAYLSLRMVEMAASIGCRRFVGIGSQAEYGSILDVIKEDETQPKPFCGYGAAKVAACEFTKRRSKELGIEWVWGRIFSIYGNYEPKTRLLPHLIDSFVRNEDLYLSSCKQNWDFLYGSDAGEAILAMAERGRDGEIYNIADGRWRPLWEYVDIVRSVCGLGSKVTYGDDPDPFVSLQPSVDKLKSDTGWEPKADFKKKILGLIKEKSVYDS